MCYVMLFPGNFHKANYGPTLYISKQTTEALHSAQCEFFMSWFPLNVLNVSAVQCPGNVGNPSDTN